MHYKFNTCRSYQWHICKQHAYLFFKINLRVLEGIVHREKLFGFLVLCSHWTQQHNIRNMVHVQYIKRSMVRNKTWKLLSSYSVRGNNWQQNKFRSKTNDILYCDNQQLNHLIFIVSIDQRQSWRNFFYHNGASATKWQTELSGITTSLYSKLYNAALLPRRGRILRRTLSVRPSRYRCHW